MRAPVRMPVASTVREALPLQRAFRTEPAPLKRATEPAWVTLVRLTRGSAVERIELVRSGIPAVHLPEVASAMGIANSTLIDGLQIARTSLARRITQQSMLAPDESERVVGLLALIGQVADMLRDSGVEPSQADLRAARWLGAWIVAPNNALGTATPLSYLDTADGRGLVSRLIGAMESGTYW